MTPLDIEYRKSAAEATSGFALLIALYDTLAGDLRRAAEAERRNDISGRSREVKHALAVIGYLEAWVERGDRGGLANQLVSFYGSLRCALMDAQARRSATLLEEQMARVLALRECWQKLDQTIVPERAEAPLPVTRQNAAFDSTQPEERGRMSWLA